MLQILIIMKLIYSKTRKKPNPKHSHLTFLKFLFSVSFYFDLNWQNTLSDACGLCLHLGGDHGDWDVGSVWTGVLLLPWARHLFRLLLLDRLVPVTSPLLPHSGPDVGGLWGESCGMIATDYDNLNLARSILSSCWTLWESWSPNYRLTAHPMWIKWGENYT